MSHSTTELLIDYWRRRLPAFGSPRRAAIDPGEIAALLPQVFILGRADSARYAFRLAGGLLTDLHGAEMRGRDFLALWRPVDRASLQSAMEGAARRSHALIVTASGASDKGGGARFEIVLAPLAADDGTVDRFLGLYQPLSPVAALDGRPIEALQLIGARIAGEAGGPTVEAPRLRLAAIDGRLIA